MIKIWDNVFLFIKQEDVFIGRQKKIMGIILGMINIDYCYRLIDEIKY